MHQSPQPTRLQALSHVACVAVSAFSLFLIQPLMAKYILPIFGGTAAVWAVCLVFYQSLLLGGYLYAHAVASRLSPRHQSLVHIVLVAAALLGLPQVSATMNASGASPSIDITLLLARAIGLPYLLLSSTSPLLQAWRAGAGFDPRIYRLFAWSNAACVVALLCFPFVLERYLPLSQITTLWQATFVIAALLHLICVLQRRRATAEPFAERSGILRWEPLWFWLPFLGSALLVAVTGHLTQMVAPVPLLWVLPLLLYLMSFVVVFGRDRYASNWGVFLGLGSFALLTLGQLYVQPERMMQLGIAVFCIGLFGACLMLHGELAVRRPSSTRLTAFYVALAAGGAGGSIFTAMVATLLFKYPIELAIITALAAVTAAMLMPRVGLRYHIAAALALLVCLGVPSQWATYADGTLVAVRNFYGALRITQRTVQPDRPPLRAMVHGAVNHGSEYIEGDWRKVPLTYFGRNSGAGLLLSRPSTAPRRIGVIGLGAGTLAAYGREGDVIRFYEINPLVVGLAQRYFAYMNDSAARVEVVMGDARVSMEREKPQEYDVLLIDAFNGDSVPVHLLTREAFEVYLRHVRPGGTVAFHVSNRYLDLQLVVRQIAAGLGRNAMTITNQPDPATGAEGAVWVLMDARRPATPPKIARPDLQWTDDRSSVLGILR